MSSVNPQGCKVVSFKTPSPEEFDHDFLWRVHQKAPAKGQISGALEFEAAQHAHLSNSVWRRLAKSELFWR